MATHGADRVVLIERALRRQRGYNLVAIVAFCLIAAGDSGKGLPEEIAAQRFVVRAEGGRELALFGLDSDNEGDVTLSMRSADGTESRLHVDDGRAGLVLATGDGRAIANVAVQAWHPEAPPVDLFLRSSDSGSINLSLYRGAPPRLVLDDNNYNTISLGQSSTGLDREAIGLFIEPAMNRFAHAVGGFYMKRGGDVTLQLLDEVGESHFIATTTK